MIDNIKIIDKVKNNYSVSFVDNNLMNIRFFKLTKAGKLFSSWRCYFEHRPVVFLNFGKIPCCGLLHFSTNFPKNYTEPFLKAIREHDRKLKLSKLLDK